MARVFQSFLSVTYLWKMKHILKSIFLTFFSVAAFAQNDFSVDFKHVLAKIAVHPEEGRVEGDLSYSFDVLKETDSVFIDAQKMQFFEVLLNGENVDFGNDQNRLWVVSDFEPAVDQKLQLKYSATPQKAMYFIDKAAGEAKEFQVWTQGQGKYTSNWLPSFDDTNEKLEFDLQIDFPKGKEVIANGKLIKRTSINDSIVRWAYDMENAMSSYLVAVAAGDFEKEEFTTHSGVPLELYYPKGEEAFVEPTYRYTGRIMDFFEKKIGVDYPWQNYKQVPVRDFLYAGMENTGTTIFSDTFLVDSIGFNDRNYVNVNAHELAHQWFGNLVTAASGEHHWLQEGFATYYALLAEKEIFGEDHFYWKLYESAEQLKQLSDSGKGEALLNPAAGSLTFYQKGAWALFFLENLVGQEVFDLGVKNYLQKHQFKNVTTADFLSEIEKASGKDLAQFRKDWLEQSAFQGTMALEELKKSDFIRKYLEVAALKPLAFENKKTQLRTALSFPVNDYIGQEAVYQLALEEPSEVIELYNKAFGSNNLFTRQAIALSLQQIPLQLKLKYEDLLNDDSYVTQEAALYHLWMNFPEEREKYLQKMEGVEGFSDKNIRSLWLALNLATPEVSAADKRKYLDELISYTAPHQKYQVREKAFSYLYQINGFNEEAAENILDATKHHNYRFRSFARELKQTLIEEDNLEPEVKKLLQ